MFFCLRKEGLNISIRTTVSKTTVKIKYNDLALIVISRPGYHTVLVQGPARTKRSFLARNYSKGGDSCVYSRKLAERLLYFEIIIEVEQPQTVSKSRNNSEFRILYCGLAPQRGEHRGSKVADVYETIEVDNSERERGTTATNGRV